MRNRSRPRRARFLRRITTLMPKVPITMPQLGESMAEATIVAIKVQPGEKVAADQEIIEVETDKAVMGVTTPCPGEIAKIDAEVKGVYRGRRRARICRGERSGRGAFHRRSAPSRRKAKWQEKCRGAKRNPRKP